MVCTATL